MPDIASVLKSEIARISRKVLRGEVDSLKKATASYRRDIAALKKRIQQLERQIGRAPKSSRVVDEPGSARDGAAGRKLRFSANRFAAQRTKAGLSAANYAKLLGVSPLSVYKWESGQTRPRQAQLEAIASLRNLGKREVAARLSQLEAAGARK